MRAALSAPSRRPAPPEARPTTLLELVTALSELSDDEEEVIAAVLSLLRAGHVRLCGNFRDAPISDLE